MPIGILSWKYYQTFTIHRVVNSIAVVLCLSGMITGMSGHQ
jgi:hypothetical protein